MTVTVTVTVTATLDGAACHAMQARKIPTTSGFPKDPGVGTLAGRTTDKISLHPNPTQPNNSGAQDVK